MPREKNKIKFGNTKYLQLFINTNICILLLREFEVIQN